MTPGREAATRLLMEQVGQTVRAVLRRKSGLTLADDDARAENLDALDVYQDTLTRVWERLANTPPGEASIADLKAYATTVANNLWSDYLRQRHPRRASLKNRLRYFLSHAPDYAIWEGSDSSLQCGRRAWQYGTSPADPARIQKLRAPHSGLRVPPKSMERFSVEDWNRLLSGMMDRLGGPVSLDVLVALVAHLLAVKEDRVESLDAEENGEPAFRELPDTEARTPEQDTALRDSVAELWAAVTALRPDYRCAYLLNIPGPGKSRGDIEVFVDLGVVRMLDMAAVLDLNDAQYALAWEALELSPAERAEIGSLSSREDKFCFLWKHLPLPDALIARLLGIQQQQVINRRTLALRALARALSRGEA